MVGNGSFQTFHIIGIYMDKAGSQRLEQFMVVLLTGGGQGGQGTTVETIL